MPDVNPQFGPRTSSIAIWGQVPWEAEKGQHLVGGGAVYHLEDAEAAVQGFNTGGRPLGMPDLMSEEPSDAGDVRARIMAMDSGSATTFTSLR